VCFFSLKIKEIGNFNDSVKESIIDDNNIANGDNNQKIGIILLAYWIRPILTYLMLVWTPDPSSPGQKNMGSRLALICMAQYYF